ncbi:uncharacterized protein EAF01_009932 [Botrytis porri]|uniref:Alcohol acetyltransferase n=1 Tax=Botrytis porri TaxID=87229 RepID=A0A4Z1KXH7_9HELO|nr:uncharacterized protein EAF01_009932 [Botrytis porri]KAF7894481.1 hypothetical protein EAF01_009932 [Botrytis porri]TGO89110.1 hypothetical protein BPOR_0125g00180 [Botrytis porri]
MDHNTIESNTFPAGLLGTYYSTRHELGLYRSCAVTSHYIFTPRTPHPTAELTSRLQHALHKTIKTHPSLCHGLLPRSKSPNLPARFKRLSQISWDDLVSISSLTTSSDAASPEKRLCEELGVAHEMLFRDQETTPAWKLRVFVHEVEDQTYKVYILFVVNHAIADGLSCAAFQRTLHEQLSLATVEIVEKSDVQWPYIVPDTIGKPIAIEDAMEISPPGYESLAPNTAALTLTDQKEEEMWTGNFPNMPTLESYKSLVLLVTIPPEKVPQILQISRRLKITVTGYLHGLITRYLARTAITNNQLGLKACTPYSLRKFSKLPLSEIANHVAYMTTTWDAELLNEIRHAEEESPEEESLIATIGRQITHEISTHLSRIEAGGGVPQLRKVAKIPDLESYCREGMSAERSESYELSNLGVVRMKRVPEENPLKLNGLVFSQCGMVFGAPIGCNVVNLEGGPLVISLTWQKGGVESKVMEGLQRFLKKRLGA